MDNQFFERPILNSPYEYPARHWELDEQGQPTQRIIDRRRRAEFITPIAKPKKRKGGAAQQSIVFDKGPGLSTAAQQYDSIPIINELRGEPPGHARALGVRGVDGDLPDRENFEAKVATEFDQMIGEAVDGEALTGALP